MYFVQTLGDDGKPSTNYAVDSEEDFDAIYGAPVTLNYQSLYHGDQKVLKKAIKGYTFDHATLTDGETTIDFDEGDTFNVSSLDDPAQIVKLYYNVDYYEPPEPPGPPSPEKPAAFTAHYMLQTKAAAKENKADITDPTLWAEADTETTSPDYFGGYYSAKVDLDYKDPEHLTHGFTKSITGYDYLSATYKADATTDAVTFDNEHPFNITVTDDGKHPQEVYFYFTREFYDPDPPTPGPEAEVGYIVKYLGKDVNSTAADPYTIELKQTGWTTNAMEFDAFYGETISIDSSAPDYYLNYKSREGKGVVQTFTNWSLSQIKLPTVVNSDGSTEWPMTVTDQSAAQRPVITIYYDADYIGPDPQPDPDPDPAKGAITVTYKGLSLNAAKTKDPSQYEESDYTELLSNTLIPAAYNGKLSLGAYMNALVNRNYKEPEAPVGTGHALYQTFDGYTINWALTAVGETPRVGENFSFNVTGKGHTVTLYYNRNYIEPDPDDPDDTAAFTVHYMLQTIEAARNGQKDPSLGNYYTEATIADLPTGVTSPEY